MSGISGKTGLLGLLGWPVSHSLSPAMHNAAAAALGLDLIYLPLPVRPGGLEAAIAGLAALGFLGVNVTVPYKQQVMPLLDGIDPGAAAIGAVNTIVVVPGDPDDGRSSLRLLGYNTDAAGFMAHLEQLGVEVAGRECLLLGAGGAARAVAYGLAQAGARVYLVARRLPQAQQLVADLEPHLGSRSLTAHSWDDLLEIGQRLPAPLIVNATPVGMEPDEEATPWPEALSYPEDCFLYDLVYNPRETRLMREAAAAGCRVSNGLGMLLQQGARAFEIWTGKRPDLAVMRRALQK